MAGILIVHSTIARSGPSETQTGLRDEALSMEQSEETFNDCVSGTER